MINFDKLYSDNRDIFKLISSNLLLEMPSIESNMINQ